MRKTVRVCGLAAIVAVMSCNDDLTEPRTVESRAKPSLARIPAASMAPERLGMGGLQQVALQVVRAMQDEGVRKSLASAMRDPSSEGLGVDLSACTGKALGARLLETGEQRGGRSARTLCAELAVRGNFVLFMKPDQLARWDGSTLPIVTALPHPGEAMPVHLMGYRSPNLLIDIGAFPKLASPLLVVYPLKHPSRGSAARGPK